MDSDDKHMESSTPTAKYDDTLRPVSEEGAATTVGKVAMAAFVLVRLQALEKPRLEEALVEPGGGSSGCACNSVCACVPVETCACNSVCSCDTVSSCQSYSSGCNGGCNGGYWDPC